MCRLQGRKCGTCCVKLWLSAQKDGEIRMVTYLEGNDSHSGQEQSHPLLNSYKVDVSIRVSHTRVLSSLHREIGAAGSDSFDLFLSFTLE